MEETMIRPPRTIMEVFKMLPETTLAEVIDKTLYMSPAPSPAHQKILQKIFKVIDDCVEANSLGDVFISPVDLYLDEDSNAVQPDLVFLQAKDDVQVDETGLHGVPALILEVLSPGNTKHDTVIKKELYERFKVREYWIIDPKSKKATGYVLTENRYVLICEQIGSINSSILKNTFAF